MLSNKKKVKPFCDGCCKVWTAENRSLKTCLGIFYFDEETVGIKTFSEFSVLGKQVEKVISIPYNTLIEQGNVAVIQGKHYSVELIQKKDTFPLSLRLTLCKTPLRYKE